MDAYGVRHALVVGPNSGHGTCVSLLRLLADLDLFVQAQAEHGQLAALVPILLRSGAPQ